jgi:ketosteroid isomerase-like protein
MAKSELDVLEANEAFYRAFNGRDGDAMDRLWTDQLPAACIHPGWDILDGRQDVVRSWRAVLESPGAPVITCSHVQVRVLGEVAVVTCHEVVQGGRLAATNLFAREGGAWRMVLHQATPIAPGQVQPPPAGGPAN